MLADTPSAQVAGLSRPGVSKVDGKISTTVITRERKTIAHYRPSRGKKNKKTSGFQTHVFIISGFQTQGTKPLGHQNCKWPPVLIFLAWLTGKTGELRNSCFFNLLVEELEKSRCTYFGHKAFPRMLDINYNIH